MTSILSFLRHASTNRMRVLASALLLLTLLPILMVNRASGQTDGATLGGSVFDTTGAVVPDATITAINNSTQEQRNGQTNRVGNFSIQSLPPATYTVHIDKAGFEPVEVNDVELHTADRQNLQINLRVGNPEQTITVSATSITNNSPAVSLTVSREFVENMPLNGRSFQDLIQLAPGAASTKSGYYSINGQRTDSNNYTVDGISANLGGYNNNSSTTNAGSGLSGSSPSQTVLNTTQSLASLDSLQEFKIQTSGYTAEYGRNPGGQVQFTTRSGTNDVHGSLFEYLRNTAFDANTFQNNYLGTPQTPEHQNDFGGTIGGPVIIPRFYNGKDHTFYFFSYEGLRLIQPNSESRYVPTQAFRSWASPDVQPFLNAAPLPSATSPGNQDGCTVPTPTGAPTACDALFNYSYSSPSNLDNVSIRVDQNVGKRFHAFVRYADTPSSGWYGVESVTTRSINSHTWTAGITTTLTNTLLDDFRFGYSYDGEQNVTSLRKIGGAIPWDRSLLIPSQYDTPFTGAQPVVQVPGTSLLVSLGVGGAESVQHQLQVVDSLSWIRGKHNLKFGVDWRRLTPTWIVNPYRSYATIQSLAAIQQGYATNVSISAQAPGQPVLDNLSLYAQDHLHVGPRLSVDYGLRWEFNPPPGPSNGSYPVTLTSSDLSVAQLAPIGTAPFRSDRHSFAPRFGFAWDAIPSQSHPLTVRGGFGIFFDTGQSTAAYAYTGSYPFTAARMAQTNVPLPLSSVALAPPSLNTPLTQPYPTLTISDPRLTLPYTEQWNLSIDEALSATNTLTVSYVGNNGRKLLFTQAYNQVPGNSIFTSLLFTNNSSQSNYNALQITDTGRIVGGLNLVASFTWAHALDNASNDLSQYAPLYGNSDYDLRRVLNLALNYKTPIANWSHWTQALTHGWLLANRFSTQSGYPVTNIVQSTLYLPSGIRAQYVPDLVPGVPIYLHGRAADVNGEPVLGSWRLNPAAFACVPTNEPTPCLGTPKRNGNLGRNYLRNPSFWALNTALQRTFPVYEGLQLNFRAEAFNILNHPNPASPRVSSLTSSTFGELMGAETEIGSYNSLYSMGASRSLQFSLHLQF